MVDELSDRRRIEPPFLLDGRAMMQGWLKFHRTTFDVEAHVAPTAAEALDVAVAPDRRDAAQTDASANFDSPARGRRCGAQSETSDATLPTRRPIGKTGIGWPVGSDHVSGN